MEVLSYASSKGMQIKSKCVRIKVAVSKDTCFRGTNLPCPTKNTEDFVKGSSRLGNIARISGKQNIWHLYFLQQSLLTCSFVKKIAGIFSNVLLHFDSYLPGIDFHNPQHFHDNRESTAAIPVPLQ